MKMKNLLTCLVLLLTTLPAFAGNEGGGGGDATEVRVNEIRSDLLSWIERGGAKGLTFPSNISYVQYVEEMSEILRPKKVAIGFTTDKVMVKNVEKTCRGYFDVVTSDPHILCNISRFQNTSDSDQYVLIHHEYAGLVNIEKNEGSSSDYSISSQLTDYLSEQTVLKLAINKKDDTQEDEITDCDEFAIENQLLLQDIQRMTGSTTYVDLLTSYADSLYIQLITEIRQKRISNEGARNRNSFIFQVRQCANFLGFEIFH